VGGGGPSADNGTSDVFSFRAGKMHTLGRDSAVNSFSGITLVVEHPATYMP